MTLNSLTGTPLPKPTCLGNGACGSTGCSCTPKESECGYENGVWHCRKGCEMLPQPACLPLCTPKCGTPKEQGWGEVEAVAKRITLYANADGDPDVHAEIAHHADLIRTLLAEREAKAREEEREKMMPTIETRIRAAYQNGVIDGKQGTENGYGQEEVVAKEAIEAIRGIE